MTDQLKEQVVQMCEAQAGVRLSGVLRELGASRSTWYAPRRTGTKHSGRPVKPKSAQKKMRELTEGHHVPLPGNGSQLAVPTGIEILTQNDGFRVQ